MRSLVCLASVIGHDYSIFLKFKGGKGIATSFGVVFALNWRVGVVMLGAWAFLFLLFKIASLASLTSMFFVPVFFYFWAGEYFLLAIIIFGLSLVRHRVNIERLVKGEEKPIKIFTKGTGKKDENRS